MVLNLLFHVNFAKEIIGSRTKAPPPPPNKKPPNNEKYKLFIYWYLCTHFELIVPLFMG